MSCENFSLVFFNITEKEAIKQRYGRVGPGRFTTDIVSVFENCFFFVPWTMFLKSKLSENGCCEVPHVTPEGCSRLRGRSVSSH